MALRFHNLVLALLIALACLPALATKLPTDFKQLVEQEFPGSKIRLDGVLETARGDLLLPLIPGGIINVPKWGKPQVDFRFPDDGNPSLIMYNNGWCYLRLTRKGTIVTLVLPANLTEKSRKHILSCNLPSDLIVPENFVLPKSFKPIVGDLSIKLIEETEYDELGNPQQTVAHHAAAVNPASRGVFVVSSLHSGTLILLDEKRLSKIIEFPTEGTLAQMVTQGGLLYVTDQAKARVLILDPNKKEFIGQIDLAPKSAPKGIASLPNGQLLYVSESGANDIAIIEVASKKVLLRTKVPPGPGRLAVTPDGYFVLVLNSPSGQLTVISTANQAVSGSVKVGGMPTAMAISHDGHRCYVTNRLSNTVSIVDLIRRQVIGTIATGNGPTGVALNPDNSKLYVACGRDNTISIFDLKTNQKTDDVRLPLDLEFPGNLTLTPDGKKLIVTSEAAEAIGVMDLNTLTFDSQVHLGHTSHDAIWMPVQ